MTKAKAEIVKMILKQIAEERLKEIIEATDENLQDKNWDLGGD